MQTPRAALRHSELRTVVLEDHADVLRLLAKRHHDHAAELRRIQLLEQITESRGTE